MTDFRHCIITTLQKCKAIKKFKIDDDEFSATVLNNDDILMDKIQTVDIKANYPKTNPRCSLRYI